MIADQTISWNTNLAQIDHEYLEIGNLYFENSIMSDTLVTI